MRRLAVTRESASAIASTVLLVASVLVFDVTVMQIPLADTGFFDLQPEPDAVEYFAGAVSLYHDHAYQVHFAGRGVPPRYPFGYSVLMLPFLSILEHPIEAPFFVNRAVGLLLIFGLFGALWRAGHVVAAGLAALLMATMPAFVALSRAPMSDLSGSAIVLASLWLFWRFRQDDRRLAAALVGSFILGLSISFRIVNLLFATLIPAVVAWGTTRPWRRRLALGSAMSAAWLIGALPLLAYHAASFGSPFRTGYGYWLGSTPASAFGVRYLWPNVDMLGRDVLQIGTVYTTANIYGTGSHITPCFAMLALACTVVNVRRRQFWILSAPLLGFLGAMLFYKFQAGRFIFPIFVAAVPLIAVTTVGLIARRMRTPTARDWIVAAATVVLLVGAVLGYSGRGRLELGRLMGTKRFLRVPPNYTAVTTLDRIMKGRPALVLVDMNPAYVYALTTGDRLVSPIYGRDWGNPSLRLNTSDRDKQIAAAISGNRIVYLLFMGRRQTDVADICRPPPGYEWRVVWRFDRYRGLAKLERSVGRAVPAGRRE